MKDMAPDFASALINGAFIAAVSLFYLVQSTFNNNRWWAIGLREADSGAGNVDS